MMTLSGKPNSTANSVAETLGFRECLLVGYGYFSPFLSSTNLTFISAVTASYLIVPPK